ncbi:MAG: ADP-glyceromanno-heptose 6-epimerase [Syntrophales bacterium]|jgi:ADP-L-glycero-D-manno-heptose 6-epimerase|nr:ADP-glyceromanno-heptose 6-epimerase [Syntrophales bacterium]MDY0044537.1 ADP-glyceromanno-heptose 6-epimerase [Syntrophales bacterium]
MITVTGGAGFIGSAFVWKLNKEGIDDILIVDNLGSTEKWKNLVNLKFFDYVSKERFQEMILNGRIPTDITAIVHMGACSSTVERNASYLMENNYRYSRNVAEWALRKDIRFIYASSAATYGDGSNGFFDDNETTVNLRPINMYGYSKQLFDQWVLRNRFDLHVTGIKFFNVFGPNEYHKGEMRSVIHKAWGQIEREGFVELFRSYRQDYKDGEQKRDFIYIKDCVEVLFWFLNAREATGIFNLGTGNARSWNDLVRAVFNAMKIKPTIQYIEMPEEIRNQYQYYTEAPMEKLRTAGFDKPFHSLEEAITDYVNEYLAKGERCLE